MCKVRFEFDEDWKDDLVDLQGKVVLLGKNGTAIIESCTNIDSFLAALSKIALALRESAEARPRIDLTQEPDPLCGNIVSNGEVELTYGRQLVLFPNLTQFESQLQLAVKAFTEYLPLRGIGDRASMETLNQFLELGESQAES